jgi:hypothetical protein
MARPATSDPNRATTLAEALERLADGPLDGFVARRRELASSLRAAGELPAARFVAAASKPSRTTWALNHVARHSPELLTHAFEARDAAAEALSSGDAEAARATARAFRERVAVVVQAAREAAAADGAELTAAHARRIGETVQAVSADGAEARAKLLAGRLAGDVEAEEAFAGIELRVRPPVDEEPTAPEPAPVDELRRAREERAARKAREAREAALEAARKREALREAARQQVTRAEEDAHRAQTAAIDAEREAGEARARFERAARAAAEAEARVAEARRALAALD